MNELTLPYQVQVAAEQLKQACIHTGTEHLLIVSRGADVITQSNGAPRDLQRAVADVATADKGGPELRSVQVALAGGIEAANKYYEKENKPN